MKSSLLIITGYGGEEDESLSLVNVSLDYNALLWLWSTGMTIGKKLSATSTYRVILLSRTRGIKSATSALLPPDETGASGGPNPLLHRLQCSCLRCIRSGPGDMYSVVKSQLLSAC